MKMIVVIMVKNIAMSCSTTFSSSSSGSDNDMEVCFFFIIVFLWWYDDIKLSFKLKNSFKIVFQFETEFYIVLITIQNLRVYLGLGMDDEVMDDEDLDGLDFDYGW